MPDYQVKIVDAFTTRRYAGNPCGVVTRAEGLTEAQMQA
ncbi:MAG: PhzF family phenazine biosynthesis protein, partial [Dehalococcoidia bacterium]|nr:PhzF family phenazine biosynthesis protein [Dehalococcoidia bacterium]